MYIRSDKSADKYGLAKTCSTTVETGIPFEKYVNTYELPSLYGSHDIVWEISFLLMLDRFGSRIVL